MNADDASSLRDVVAGAVRAWADRGWLRSLDAALAEFVADICPSADGTVLLAAALVAHLEGQGHACLVLGSLLDDPAGLLGWEADAIDALTHVLARLPADEDGWRAALARCDAVAVAGSPAAADGGEPFVLDAGRLYLRRYWRYERRIATAVAARATTIVPVDVAAAGSWIELLFARRTAVGEVDWQRVATALALRGTFTIVTGGPGTGKTWTAARFIALLLATTPDPSTLRIALAAPTGKAAARLRQSIDAAFVELSTRVGDRLPLAALAARIGAARTLHSLLGTRRGSRRFRHDAAHPLAIDLLVVDEASMVNVEMMDALVDALPSAARLMLLGDKDQLSSVEAGAVLGELCGAADNRFDATVAGYLAATTGDAVAADASIAEAAATRVVALRRSERFGGAIDGLARAVNGGRGADARALLRDGQGAIAWSDAADPAAVVELALGGYADYLAARTAPPDSLFAEDHEAWVRRVVDAFERFRLLCAVRVGEWGVVALNRAIEERLARAGRVVGGGAWYEGRPVLVGRNDYDVGVFNGDIGIALRASPADARLRVWFADGASSLRAVAPTRLADVETAFAMTVHKSQGSEFAHTALVLPPAGSRVVTRELLYTGITRARERFTLVAPSTAEFDDAVARRTSRSSGIGAMLAR